MGYWARYRQTGSFNVHLTTPASRFINIGNNDRLSPKKYGKCRRDGDLRPDNFVSAIRQHTQTISFL